MRTCPVCRKDFEPKAPNQRYCESRGSCYRRVQNDRYRRRLQAANCKCCGTEFLRSPDARKSYCSLECQYQHRSAEYIRRGILPPLRTVDPTSVMIGDYFKALRSDPCAYCGDPSEAIDHIEARSRGGANEWENYAGVCKSCNSTKRDRSVLGTLMYLQLRPEIEALNQAVLLTAQL